MCQTLKTSGKRWKHGSGGIGTSLKRRCPIPQTKACQSFLDASVYTMQPIVLSSYQLLTLTIVFLTQTFHLIVSTASSNYTAKCTLLIIPQGMMPLYATTIGITEDVTQPNNCTHYFRQYATASNFQMQQKKKSEDSTIYSASLQAIRM